MNDCWHTNSAGSVINLNDRTRYSLRDITGLFHLPGAAILTDVPLKTPRAIYQGQNPSMRTCDLVLTVHGRTTEDAFDNMRLLYAHFWVDARDDELGTLRYIAMNGVDRWTYVTPPQGDDPLLDQWWIARSVARAGIELSIRLIAPDPTWYAPTAVSSFGAFVGVGAIPVLCTNPGDVAAWTIINLDPAFTQTTTPLIVDNYAHSLQFTGTITPPRDLTCNLNPQRGQLSIELDDGTNWLGLRYSGSQLIQARPGAHNITFTGGNAGDDGMITVSFYPRYSSHG